MEKETPIDLGRWITGVIMEFAASSAENTIQTDAQEKAFGTPLVGFSSGMAPFWTRSDSGPYAPCSNWSERHCAYAAGLGTFGLCQAGVPCTDHIPGPEEG